MSLTVSTPLEFTAYTDSVPIQVFLSNYYTLTANDDNPNPNPFFISFQTYKKSDGTNVSYYNVDFGDGFTTRIDPNQNAYHNYSQEGTYFIAYSAIYVSYTTNVETAVPFNLLDFPINVKSKWSVFDQNNIRLNNEIVLSFPYSLDQIKIQPNEWGVSDIFNTAIERLQYNLEYLSSNLQTIDTTTPTNYFGWLGNISPSKSSTIKWITQSSNSFYYETPEIATNTGNTYFADIKDATQINDIFYVIDNNNIRFLTNSQNPEDIEFKNILEINDLIKFPTAFDVDDSGKNMYICDAVSNKIYNIYIDFENSVLNLNLNLGGFGNYKDNNKFNSPNEIRFINNNVYVLDYNNKCIKQYNKTFNWTFTYFNDDLQKNGILGFDIHPTTSLVYVLAGNNTIYIYDNQSNVLYETINVNEILDDSAILKLIFDDSGDFMYILTEKNVYKYSAFGYFINTFNIPKGTTINYKNIKKSDQKGIIISSDYCLFRCQDILNIYRIGNGLSYKYWTPEQLMVSEQEFASDIVYNRCLVRMAQNIKTLRETINFKFGILTEPTTSGSTSVFTIIPVTKNDLPVFGDDVENETLGVGVNELHIPEVLNKELLKLHKAMDALRDFLSIKNVNTVKNDCTKSFSWSWKATACYNLVKPIVKICGINPISYAELDANPIYQYAPNPTTTWAQASSYCVE